MPPDYGAELERQRHWEAVYGRTAATKVSWYQDVAAISLGLIESLGIAREAAIVDVGGGASTFAGGLVSRGYQDVSVLDVSEAALDVARERLGPPASDSVHWFREDVLAWRPSRSYHLWHDRAVFHFLVDPTERDRYASTLRSALHTDGFVIVATFASDGPDHCSGLPVARYSPDELLLALGGLDLVEACREEHITPAGVVQPFTWVVARQPVGLRG